MLQALCVVTSASAPGKITSVAVNKVGTGVELVVSGEGLSKPKVFPFLNGKMRVVEFAAGMRGNGGKTEVRQGPVRSYNTFWYKSTPPTVRINVRLTNSVDPVLVETEHGWKLGFGVAKEDLQAKVVDTAIKSDFPETLPPLVLNQPKTEEPLKTVEVKTQPAPKPAEKFPETVPPLKIIRKTPNQTVALHVPATPKLQDVSIDFVNTDIVQVLKAIAIQSNVNIVTSPDVKGIVTVSLRNVSVDEALRIVTSLGQLGYAKVGATFIVAPADKIDAIRRSITGEVEPTQAQPQKEPDSMVTYSVKGGKAADLVKAIIGDAKDGRVGNLSLIGTPAESASLQTIVIRGPRTEADSMVRILEQLDNAVQPNVTTEIYDVRFADPRSLREDLISAFPGLRASIAPSSIGNPRLYNTNEQANQNRQGFSGGPGQANSQNGGAVSNDTGTGGATTRGAELQTGVANLSEREQRGLTLPYSDFEAVSVPMRLVLRGTAEQIAAARAYAARVDTQPKQIALELRVMELTKNDAQRIGLDWSILAAGGLVNLRVNQGFGDSPNTPGTITGEASRGAVLATLDAVANNRNLIARPNLLALDGRETEVFVGDVIRYIEAIQSTQNGITVQTNEVRVGVRLAVLARAGADNNITMDLRPILSFLRGFTPTPAGGQLPQTSERISQSTAVLRSGETLALGGLIQDVDRNNVSGIPILKDLPIVGALFRRTDKSKDRTEIVFFLTARVVDETTRQDAARPKG